MPFYIMKQNTLIEGCAAIDSVPDNIDSLDWIQGKRVPNQAAKTKHEKKLFGVGSYN